MIRINLLPVRASKKRELGRQWLVLFALVLVGALVGNYLWWSEQEKTLEAIQTRITKYEQDVATLNKIIGEVKNIKAQKAEMEQKLGTLKTLRDGRTGPVKVMDELATIVPQRVWLASFDESGGTAHLTGQATAIDEVANFVKKLQTSKFFTNPQSGAISVGANDRVSFSITAGIKYSP